MSGSPPPLRLVEARPSAFRNHRVAAAKVDPLGARGFEQCAGEPPADLRGRCDVTRVSILEPAFAAVHEPAVGTSPTMCSSARRPLSVKLLSDTPTSASVRNRRVSLIPVRPEEGRLTEP